VAASQDSQHKVNLGSVFTQRLFLLLLFPVFVSQARVRLFKNGHDFRGHKDTISRQKRASPDNSQQKSVQTASEVRLLIKQELRLLQNQFCAKDETLCRSGPKGNTGRRGRPGIRGKPGSPGITGP